jgi:hypothetical protein
VYLNAQNRSCELDLGYQTVVSQLLGKFRENPTHKERQEREREARERERVDRR